MLQSPLIRLLKSSANSKKHLKKYWISNTRAKQLDSQLDEWFTNSWAHFCCHSGPREQQMCAFLMHFWTDSSVVKGGAEKNKSSNPIAGNNSGQKSMIKVVKERKKDNLFTLQSSWPWDILTACYTTVTVRCLTNIVDFHTLNSGLASTSV